MPVPQFDCGVVQWILFQSEAGDAIHLRGGEQTAFEVVSPGVVGALNCRGEPSRFFLGQPGTSVAADVVIRAEAPLDVPDDNQTLAGDVAHDKIARVGNLLGASRVDPHPKEKRLELGAKIVRRRCNIWLAGSWPRAAMGIKPSQRRASVGIRVLFDR